MLGWETTGGMSPGQRVSARLTFHLPPRTAASFSGLFIPERSWNQPTDIINKQHREIREAIAGTVILGSRSRHLRAYLKTKPKMKWPEPSDIRFPKSPALRCKMIKTPLK